MSEQVVNDTVMKCPADEVILFVNTEIIFKGRKSVGIDIRVNDCVS